MTLIIPRGWKYVGVDYTGHSNSFPTELEAQNEAMKLQDIYKNQDFSEILDDSGGDNYKRWVVIMKKNSLYDRDRKKSCKRTNKSDRKKCKCKK